ncbi:MAG: hypothetical protein JWN34_6014 [Bryobacterales bacterium]|nr:hypothetical protein [Bryobacterales bacterium]
MQEGFGRSWREVADHHHAALVSELALAFDSQLNGAVSEAVAEERRRGDARAESARTLARSETQEHARRTVSDDLNQALRRVRQTPSKGGVLALLAEASSAWANSAAVLSIGEDGDTAQIAASRNLNLGNEPEAISLDDATALQSVIDTGDPVTCLASPSQLSTSLSEAFGSDKKCQLLPVTVRGRVAVILLAADDVVTGALELLTEAAGMRLEVLDLPSALKPLPAPGLVQIGTPAVAPTQLKDGAPKWDELPAAEQKAHLHAQRIARVRVAEIRLYQGEALRQGVFTGNIYASLREQIDQARTEFLQTCLTQSPTMVDYLHLEILRSLAHDDERLLGSDYPGPMV